MVQVRDNLTQLTGTIADRVPHPRLPGYDEVAIDIADAGPAGDDKPDLLHAKPGDQLRVAVRSELLGDAAAGARVHLRAARTSAGEVMAEPHPEEGRFAIS